KELEAAFDFDKANEEPIKGSSVETTQSTSEPSEVEPAQAAEVSETSQPEPVSDEPLDLEPTQASSELEPESDDVTPQNDEAFNRDDFIDDLFGVA
ncbi:hypothetical protein SGI37_20195, partial [Providencia rettgeri]